MTFQIKKATKSQSKLRMAMFGPSGGGKTMSSLRIAAGMLDGTGKRIGLIDTERGSASKYSDRFDFDVIELDGKKDIDTMTRAIDAFAKAGHGALIIDSMTHAWQELLAEVDRLAATKFGGNTWSAWSKGTPKQLQLVDAILAYPGHVIATMRSKTEWTTEKNEKGKNTPVRVGLAPQQGKGIEYEFDILLELSTSHIGEFIKDRTGKFQDVTVEKPGEDLGRELAAWLSEGAPAAQEAAPEPTEETPTGSSETPKAGLSKEKAAGLHAALGKVGLKKLEHPAFATEAVKREIVSFKELTTGEAKRVYDTAQQVADGSIEWRDGKLVSPPDGEFPPEPDAPLFGEDAA